MGLPHAFHCLAQTVEIGTRAYRNAFLPLTFPSHFLLIIEPFSLQPGVSAHLSYPSFLTGSKAIPPPGHPWHSQGTAATPLPRQLPKGPL